MSSDEKAVLRAEFMRTMFRFRGVGFLRHGTRMKLGFPPPGVCVPGGRRGARPGPPPDMPFPGPPGLFGELDEPEIGVSVAELAFMKHLAPPPQGVPAPPEEAGRPDLTKMREFLHVSKAGLSQMISGLEKKGFVTRKVDPENRRRIIVTLTEKGESAVAAIHRTFEAKLDVLIERFGADEMREMIRLVNRFADTIEEVLKEDKD